MRAITHICHIMNAGPRFKVEFWRGDDWWAPSFHLNVEWRGIYYWHCWFWKGWRCAKVEREVSDAN